MEGAMIQHNLKEYKNSYAYIYMSRKEIMVLPPSIIENTPCIAKIQYSG